LSEMTSAEAVRKPVKTLGEMRFANVPRRNMPNSSTSTPTTRDTLSA